MQAKIPSTILRMLLSAIIWLPVTGFSAQAFGKEIYLSVMLANYDAQLAKVEYGDTILLQEFRRKFGFFGKSIPYKMHSYRVGERLGNGSGTQVFELLDEPDKVLRLNLSSERRPIDEDDTDDFNDPDYMMKAAHWGHKDLVKYGVPHTKIYFSQFGEFMVVERAEGPTFLNFLEHPEKFSKEERQEMREGLKEFARASCAFQKIADFNAEQLVYAKKQRKWLLRDWGHNHSLASRVDNSSIWSVFLGHNLSQQIFANHLPLVLRTPSGDLIPSWSGSVIFELDRETDLERVRRGMKGTPSSPPNLKNYSKGGSYGHTEGLLTCADILQ